MESTPKDCPLTVRQYEVLLLVCEGLTYRQISRRLNLSCSAVRGHVSEACGRLRVTDVRQAMVLAGRRGWLPWQPPPARHRTSAREQDPLLVALAAGIDRWVNSGFDDQDARDSWHLTLQAIRARDGRTRRSESRPSAQYDRVRELLHHVAADTLNPRKV